MPKSYAVSDLRWRTARRSVGNGACVEAAPASGAILVRDSQDQTGPVMQYSGKSSASVIAGARIDRRF